MTHPAIAGSAGRKVANYAALHNGEESENVGPSVPAPVAVSVAVFSLAPAEARPKGPVEDAEEQDHHDDDGVFPHQGDQAIHVGSPFIASKAPQLFRNFVSVTMSATFVSGLWQGPAAEQITVIGKLTGPQEKRCGI